jgi:hypothetical protein
LGFEFGHDINTVLYPRLFLARLRAIERSPSMKDITVVFTDEHDPDTGKKRVYVQPEVEFAARGERINWQFYATDSPIKHAVVLFEGPEGAKPKYFKFKKNNQDKDDYKFPKEMKHTGTEKGTAVTYGEVPASSSPATNKYTILGFTREPEENLTDAQLKEAASALVDPKIIMVP